MKLIYGNRKSKLGYYKTLNGLSIHMDRTSKLQPPVDSIVYLGGVDGISEFVFDKNVIDTLSLGELLSLFRYLKDIHELSTQDNSDDDVVVYQNSVNDIIHTLENEIDEYNSNLNYSECKDSENGVRLSNWIDDNAYKLFRRTEWADRNNAYFLRELNAIKGIVNYYPVEIDVFDTVFIVDSIEEVNEFIDILNSKIGIYENKR